MKKVLLVITIFALVFPDILSANSMGSSRDVKAIGVSADYVRDPGSADQNDMNLSLSYRNGFIFIASLFFAADFGYQFKEKSYNTKFGFQAMFIIFGIETGVAYKFKKEEIINKSLTGCYLGLVTIFPFSSSNLFSVSIGGNFYKNKKENEFYCRLTTAVSFND